MTQDLASTDNSPEKEFEMGVSDNLQLSWDSFAMIMKKAGMTMSNLSFVYFFEYSITTSFGIAAVHKMCEQDPLKCTNEFVWVQAFTILYFCY